MDDSHQTNNLHYATKQAFVNLRKLFGPSTYQLCWAKDIAATHAQHNKSTIDFLITLKALVLLVLLLLLSLLVVLS